MANIQIDFNQERGMIKPMHAVGQPPMAGGFGVLDFSYVDYLKQAHIPYSRLHDVGGAYGQSRFVDIPNLFRNFDADENDPANYDFTFTDVLIAGILEYDVKPIFRLGVTIENQFHIKAYHIYPPKDYGKWARICEHVIRHYNEGWADGFRYGIEYWEIWNEPDNNVPGLNQMWIGTNEQFYELYDVAAKHLKACFGDSIKVGGYGACSPRGIFYDPEKYGIDPEVVGQSDKPAEIGIFRLEFLEGFFAYIKEHGSPLDFFSWHSYANVEQTTEMSKFFGRFLASHGYEGLENMLNEWNGPHAEIQHGTSQSAAQVAAMMCSLQRCPVDMLCYYDARLNAGRYAGFFHPYNYTPVSTYYSFKAFGKLYAMGTEVACESNTKKLYAIAAKGNGCCGALITNTTDTVQEVSTTFEGGIVYLIDGDHFLTATDWDSKQFTLQENQTVYIEK
ncbi:MAG: hypothetical protein IJP27_04625 [Clostridia bacterium]|nr:hypothetical protein [Clostridia bacterium]